MVPFYGCTVMCVDNEHVRAIARSIKRRVISYGISQPADYTAVSYTHLRAHETVLDLVCRLLLEKTNTTKT